jgi:hypothetical protein
LRQSGRHLDRLATDRARRPEDHDAPARKSVRLLVSQLKSS